MKLISFKFGDRAAYGAVVGESVVRLDRVAGGAPDLKSALEHFHADTVRTVPTSDRIPLDTVELLPAIPNAAKIICVATNFHEPSRAGMPDPEFPIVFTRFPDSFTGHERPLIKPAVTERFDFEGELAVVIGKRGHRIPRDRAMNHVAGYACANDGSVRDWQKHSTQFTAGKNFWRSGSLGPWIVTTDEIPDPALLQMQTRVNGVVKQDIGLGQMIFDIPWLISYFSTFTPLEAGDILLTGTPSGFGSTREPPEFLSAGDVVEVEISGVGLLRNVVRDADG